MRGLALAFKILSICGVWLPLHWQSDKQLRLFYQLFSMNVLLVTYFLISLQILLLVVNEFNLQFMAEILFTLLTAISIAFKAVNFLIRRNKIILLKEMLFNSYCIPKNACEIEMEENTNDFLRIFTIYFNALGQFTLACLFIMPLAEDPEKRELPFRVWLPYDVHRNAWNYWSTYVVEIVIVVSAILLNVTTDVIVSGFVLQACTQLDILKHRLTGLPNAIKDAKRKRLFVSAENVRLFESNALRQAFRHHDYIIK